MTSLANAGADVPLTSVDLGDPALWEQGPPFQLFARLREEAPLHWSPLDDRPQEPGFWSLTRHADIAAASRDWETWSSERGGFLMFDDIGLPLDLMRLQFITMDPPKHDRHKELFQRGFTPKRVANHAEAIRAITNRAIDRIVERGEGDLASDVAEHITARVIGSLLGTPPEDDEQIVEWANAGGGFEGDTDLRPRLEDAMRAIQEGLEYVVPRVAQRRQRPTEDLLSALANAEIDGDHFDDIELSLVFGLLIFAGTDTTKATYGSSMIELMRQRDQLELLQREPEAMANAAEECLRCFPAVTHMRRTAQRDVELHGQLIREGDKLLLWYASGNRDERVHPDPERFDVRRGLIQHQSLGAGGRHFCLGAGLARLELTTMLSETLRRLPDLEPAGPPVRVRGIWMNQFKSIPVRFTPGPRECS